MVSSVVESPDDGKKKDTDKDKNTVTHHTTDLLTAMAEIPMDA